MNFSLSNKKDIKTRIFRHFLFWVVYIIFFTLLYGSYQEDYKKELEIMLVGLPVKMLVTYFTIYFLLPKFLLTKRYWAFFGWFFLAMIFAGLMQRAMFYYLIYPLYYPELFATGFFHKFKIIRSLVNINSVAAVATVIKLLEVWYQTEQSKQDLAREKLEAELKFLKGQIHPHFLFNTMNSLYALTLTNSKKAPEIVLKLSDLLNYMLYECNAEFVSLEKEVSHLKNYIILEKLRYGDRLDISFDISGDLSGKYIAPLLLLPFIENSFKHGVSGESGKVWINGHLNIEGDTLSFKLENSLTQHQKEKDETGYTEGIGLKNVYRRLDLLYKNKHELKIRVQDSYLVSLMLELDKKPDMQKVYKTNLEDSTEVAKMEFSS